MLTFPQFLENVIDHWKEGIFYKYRFGQSFYNNLAEVRPELATYLKTINLDPFFWGDGDSRIPQVIAKIAERWHLDESK